MVRGLLVLLVLSGLLAACGVRSKPEAPEGSTRSSEPIVLDPLIE